jgi:hypothetical protein
METRILENLLFEKVKKNFFDQLFFEVFLYYFYYDIYIFFF